MYLFTGAAKLDDYPSLKAIPKKAAVTITDKDSVPGLQEAASKAGCHMEIRTKWDTKRLKMFAV